MSNQPKMLSNTEFAAGGIYPGGQILVKEFCYRLWDYAGKQAPNSNTAVYCLGQPLDGSNEGKDVEIYWNIGSAADFQPVGNGEFVVSNTREKMSEQCNWHFVYDKFIKTCGLRAEMLNGQTGIRALIGSVFQLATMPGPARNFKEDAAQPGQQGARKSNDILVPVRVQYVWDKGTAGMGMPASTPMPTPMPAPATVPQMQQVPAQVPVNGFPAQPAPMPTGFPAQAPVPAPAMNGNPADPMSRIVAAISSMIPPGGSIEVSKLWVPLIGQFQDMTVAQRTPLLNQARDQMESLAMQNGWRYDGVSLSR